MKIKKIRIQNYRSCNDSVFVPHPSLSALIGPNGSGKTNVLSAVRMLPSLCKERPRALLAENQFASLCTISTWYEVEGVTVAHVARLSIVTNERNQDEIIGSDEYWTVPGKKGGRKKVKIPSWYLYDNEVGIRSGVHYVTMNRIRYRHLFDHRRATDSETLSLLTKVVKFASEISYYSASQFTNPGSCPISFEVEEDASRRVGISITGHKRLLHDMYQESHSETEGYSEFINLVGPDGIGLVDAIEFKEIVTSTSNYKVQTGGRVVVREKRNSLVVPSFIVGGNSLSPSQLSEGTFKTLALIFYLATDKGSLLMIEEPEVCVHQGLLGSIVELIKNYSSEKQIFISTHADAVLDRLAIENVFSVKRTTEQGTVVASLKKRLGRAELAALRKYLAEEGSLGEFWKHGDLEHV